MTEAALNTYEATSLTQLTLRRFFRHRMALLSIGVLALVIFSALFASLSPYGPTEQNPANDLMPPSLDHWFGTDDLGRDVFTRTLYGGRRGCACECVLLEAFVGTGVGDVVVVVVSVSSVCAAVLRRGLLSHNASGPPESGRATVMARR